MSSDDAPQLGWSVEDLTFHRLNTTAPPSESDFDCGHEDQNRYLYIKAARDQKELIATTTLVHIDGMLAAYLTLSTDSLDLGDEQPPGIPYQYLPALKIGQMGVDERFQGHGLGTYLIGLALLQAKNMANKTGCRYLTLDARPGLKSYYEDRGFVRNKLDQEQRKKQAKQQGRSISSLPISMRFDIRERRDLPKRLGGVSPGNWGPGTID